MFRSMAVGLMGAILLLSGCGAAGHSGTPSVREPEYLRQVVTADNAHTRTVMWQSDRQEVSPAAEYRKSGDTEAHQISAVGTRYEGRAKEAKGLFIYSAELTNLEPGTAYEYRVGSDAGWSSWKSLRTDGGGAFTALIFPDSQSVDYSVWANTAQSAWKQHGGAAFFINMGDLTDNGEDWGQWRSWLDGAAPLLKEIPVAPVMGNHEAYSLDWKMKKPDAYLALFDLPKNGADSLQEYFYSYDWGPVHFTVLNTQSQELAEWYPELMDVQKQWLADDLSRTARPWKVVLMHKDVLQYPFTKNPDRKAGFSDMGEAFMPLFDQYGVDAVLTAHLHTYRDRGHIRHFQRDETGPLYILTGVAGDTRYPDLWLPHPLDVYVAPQPETDNYLTLEADEKSLRFRAFLPSGEQLEETVIEK